MELIRKSLLISCFFVFSMQIVSAQDSDQTVNLVVSGSFKTQEVAKQRALRTAIEQVFGTFISSRTEIFNDQDVANQMASVSSGIILRYDILNVSQFPDSSWGVLLKVIVSVGRLRSFVEAKGIAIELKGGLFAFNIKQQVLKEQSEIKVIGEMVGLLHEPMQISFDYTIKSGVPQSVDAESKNWEIPLVVSATTNKNSDFCANYCIRTLAALSLSPEEVTSLTSLKKDVYPVVINYNGVDKVFYLRKQTSIRTLKILTSQFKLYTRLFTVQSGLDESNGNGEGKIHVFCNKEDMGNRESTLRIYFLTKGKLAATFSWQDKRTLSQIDQMTGYKVKPRGVVSQFKHGGFVVYEINGHGLVVAPIELYFDWNTAKIACEELNLNGYGDWHLPSKEVLESVYVNFKQVGLGGFEGNYYWSSTEYDYDHAWGLTFQWKGTNTHNKTENYYVRPTRAF
jgi:hypothetical protein